MPTYRLTDDQGRTLDVEGDVPPTGEDIEFLFSQLGSEMPTEVAPPIKTPKLTPPPVIQQNQSVINRAATDQVKNKEAADIVKDRQKQQDDARKLYAKMFGSDKANALIDNPITWGEVGKYTNSTTVGGFKLPFISTGQEGIRAANILATSLKLKNNQEVTPQDQQQLEEYFKQMLEMQARGFTFGGKFRYFGQEIPAFLGEFALTGFGAGKVLAATGQEAVELGIETTGKELIKRGALQAAALAATPYGQGYKQYQNIRLNGEWEITDKGQWIVNANKENQAISAMRAFGYVSSEVAAELSGFAIANKLSKSGVTQGFKQKLANSTVILADKLPDNLKINLLKAYKAIQPNATMTKMLSQVGWNGMLLELGEERIADILRESVDLALKEGYTVQDVLDGIVPDAEQLLLEAGLITTMRGTSAATNIVANQLQKTNMTTEQAENILRSLSEQQTEDLANEALEVDGTTIQEIDTGEITPEAQAVLDQEIDSDGAVIEPEDVETTDSPKTSDETTLFFGLPLKARIAAQRFGEFTLSDIQLELRIGYNATVKALKPLIDSGQVISIKNGRYKFVKTDKPVDAPVATIVSDETVEVEQNEIRDLMFDTLQLTGTPEQNTQQEAITEPPPIAEEQSTFKGWYYQWFDDLGAIVDLAKLATSRGANTTLETTVRVWRGVTGMAKQSIEYRTVKFDEDGNVIETGEGLKTILDDWDSQVMGVEPNKEARKKDLNDYLIAQRYIELAERKDADGKPKIEISDEQKEKTAQDLARLQQKYGDKLQQLEFAAQRIYDYQKRILEQMLSSGLISQETFDTITSENKNYVPFNRIRLTEDGEALFEEDGFRDTSTTFANKSEKTVLKPIKGSELDIKDPIESIMKNVFAITDLSFQNRIAQQIIALADYVPEFVETSRPRMRTMKKGDETITQPAEVQSPQLIRVKVDGQNKFYKVNKHLAKAFENVSTQELTGLMWLLEAAARKPAEILRTGATIVPEFMARNFLRDVHGAFIQSDMRLMDIPRGLLSRIKKDELYKQWEESGGAFNNKMYLTDDGMKQAYKELISKEGKLLRYLKNPINLPNDMSMVIEQGVRLAVFNAAKRKGKTDQRAAFEARDVSIDFARGGTLSKQFNKYLPFFNAALQGTDKLFRFAKSNPKTLIMWGTATVTVPQMVITMSYLYGASEDDREEYLNIPQFQKDLFYCVKVDDVWVRYPKPFTIGYMFGSAIERLMIWDYTEGKSELQKPLFEMFASMAKSVSPVYDAQSILPPLLQTVIEQQANYDFFRQQNIYPQWMENLPPEMRVTKTTSETAKFIGEKFEVAPAEVDHLLRGTFATSAYYLTDAGDFILEQVRDYNNERLAAKPSVKQIGGFDRDAPLIRAFTMSDPTGNRANATTEFYDLAKEAQQFKSGYAKLTTPKKRKAFKEKNIIMFRTHRTILATRKQLKSLNQRRNKIYEHLTMSANQKRDALARIDQQIFRLTTKANEKFLKTLEKYE